MLLSESNIWKMTTTSNLSGCADWCAQFSFFFSTIAELRLSVRWPNPIEAPYGRSNVISQAFILCLQLDREGPRRDGIWIGDGCLREAAIERGRGQDIMYVTETAAMTWSIGAKEKDTPGSRDSNKAHSEASVNLCYWLPVYWPIFFSSGHLRLEVYSGDLPAYPIC